MNRLIGVSWGWLHDIQFDKPRGSARFKMHAHVKTQPLLCNSHLARSKFQRRVLAGLFKIDVQQLEQVTRARSVACACTWPKASLFARNGNHMACSAKQF